MTTDVTKTNVRSNNNVNTKTSARPVSHLKTNVDDERVNGYSRIKSGDHKKRNVSRSPDMSNPVSRYASADIVIGGVRNDRTKAVPIANVRTEPTVRTVAATTKVNFPYSVVFLSLICALLFFYMIFNYVQINERTSSVSDLKADIATLSFEAEELNTKLDRKNDLNLIEEIATEKLGMVKIDEITKKYITMDPGDTIGGSTSRTTEKVG